MGIRQEKAVLTRQRIIASAKRLISEKGFDNVTIDDITLDARVAKGTFYTYYKAKEDIIDEIGYLDFDAVLDKTILLEGTIVDKIIYYEKNYMRVITDAGIELCKSWVKRVIDSQNKKKLHYDKESLFKLIERTIIIKNEEEMVKKIDIIITYLYGLMITWCMSNGSIAIEELLNKDNEILLKKLFEEYMEEEK